MKHCYNNETAITVHFVRFLNLLKNYDFGTINIASVNFGIRPSKIASIIYFHFLTNNFNFKICFELMIVQNLKLPKIKKKKCLKIISKIPFGFIYSGACLISEYGNPDISI